jgi:hypothetical protein
MLLAMTSVIAIVSLSLSLPLPLFRFLFLIHGFILCFLFSFLSFIPALPFLDSGILESRFLESGVGLCVCVFLYMGVSLFCIWEPFSFSDIHSSISADYSLSPTDRLTHVMSISLNSRDERYCWQTLPKSRLDTDRNSLPSIGQWLKISFSRRVLRLKKSANKMNGNLSVKGSKLIFPRHFLNSFVASMRT